MDPKIAKKIVKSLYSIVHTKNMGTTVSSLNKHVLQKTQ